ncbi:MAG: AEC family transporter [Candidatus Saccharimonadales bacterium]
MELFLNFIAKLIPIYALIGAGFIIGRKLSVKKEAVSSLLIYLVAPVVIFNSVYTTKLTKETLLLPVIFFCLCSGIALTSYFLNSRVKPKKMRGMLAFAAGSGNTGYFGLPVALALFGEEVIGLVVLCIFGYLVYETTVGFVLIAKGEHGIKDSLQKLVRLPILYAFVAAVIVQQLGVKLGSVYSDFVPNFRGAYVLLGSLLVGLALSELTRTHFDVRAIVRSFIPKFIVWPAIVSALIVVDRHYTHFFAQTHGVYQVAFLMAIVPIAANTVAYASFLKAEPERASLIVFASTIFAIAYIPLMTSFILPIIVPQ